eukprot:TRINITY_DN2547_c2_g1_i4.p1 TRINITY_DN2547_c2_g1~~TRINITY_DN2547_c2_g1_i4.p1  ORF type:complete len:3067 (+),score=611.66 TRINITY_DN2547_c2_g1_i4:1249-9201(+)
MMPGSAQPSTQAPIVFARREPARVSGEQMQKQKRNLGKAVGIPQTATYKQVDFHWHAVVAPPESVILNHFMAVRKIGFLQKQGGEIKTWKRRVFLLFVDRLAYYKDIFLTEPTGYVTLMGATQAPDQVDHTQFALTGPERVLVIAAFTAELLSEWMAAIAAQILVCTPAKPLPPWDLPIVQNKPAWPKPSWVVQWQTGSINLGFGGSGSGQQNVLALVSAGRLSLFLTPHTLALCEEMNLKLLSDIKVKDSIVVLTFRRSSGIQAPLIVKLATRNAATEFGRLVGEASLKAFCPTLTSSACIAAMPLLCSSVQKTAAAVVIQVHVRRYLAGLGLAQRLLASATSGVAIPAGLKSLRHAVALVAARANPESSKKRLRLLLGNGMLLWDAQRAALAALLADASALGTDRSAVVAMKLFDPASNSWPTQHGLLLAYLEPKGSGVFSPTFVRITRMPCDKLGWSLHYWADPSRDTLSERLEHLPFSFQAIIHVLEGNMSHSVGSQMSAPRFAMFFTQPRLSGPGVPSKQSSDTTDPAVKLKELDALLRVSPRTLAHPLSLHSHNPEEDMSIGAAIAALSNTGGDSRRSHGSTVRAIGGDISNPPISFSRVAAGPWMMGGILQRFQDVVVASTHFPGLVHLFQQFVLERSLEAAKFKGLVRPSRPSAKPSARNSVALSASLLASVAQSAPAQATAARASVISMPAGSSTASRAKSNAALDISVGGYLYKLGGLIRKWTRRFVRAQADNLCYYDSPWDARPQGKIHLEPGTLVVKGTAQKGLKLPVNPGFVFEVVQGKTRSVFCAPTENECTTWIEDLLAIIRGEHDQYGAELTLISDLQPSSSAGQSVSPQMLKDQLLARARPLSGEGSLMLSLDSPAELPTLPDVWSVHILGNQRLYVTEVQRILKILFNPDLRSSATSTNADVLCTGFLFKLGTVNKTWKNRYFILKETGEFLCYTSAQSATPLSMVQVQGCTVRLLQDPVMSTATAPLSLDVSQVPKRMTKWHTSGTGTNLPSLEDDGPTTLLATASSTASRAAQVLANRAAGLGQKAAAVMASHALSHPPLPNAWIFEVTPMGSAATVAALGRTGEAADAQTTQRRSAILCTADFGTYQRWNQALQSVAGGVSTRASVRDTLAVAQAAALAQAAAATTAIPSSGDSRVDYATLAIGWDSANITWVKGLLALRAGVLYHVLDRADILSTTTQLDIDDVSVMTIPDDPTAANLGCRFLVSTAKMASVFEVASPLLVQCWIHAIARAKYLGAASQSPAARLALLALEERRVYCAVRIQALVRGHFARIRLVRALVLLNARRGLKSRTRSTMLLSLQRTAVLSPGDLARLEQALQATPAKLMRQPVVRTGQMAFLSEQRQQVAEVVQKAWVRLVGVALQQQQAQPKTAVANPQTLRRNTLVQTRAAVGDSTVEDPMASIGVVTGSAITIFTFPSLRALHSAVSHKAPVPCVIRLLLHFDEKTWHRLSVTAWVDAAGNNSPAGFSLVELERNAQETDALMWTLLKTVPTLLTWKKRPQAALLFHTRAAACVGFVDRGADDLREWEERLRLHGFVRRSVLTRSGTVVAYASGLGLLHELPYAHPAVTTTLPFDWTLLDEANSAPTGQSSTGLSQSSAAATAAMEMIAAAPATASAPALISRAAPKLGVSPQSPEYLALYEELIQMLVLRSLDFSQPLLAEGDETVQCLLDSFNIPFSAHADALRNIRRQVGAVASCTEGVLHKRWDKNKFSGFQRRWFVFDGDRLVYYRSAPEPSGDAQAPLGHLPLERIVRVEKVEGPTRQVRLVCRQFVAGGEAVYRTYILRDDRGEAAFSSLCRRLEMWRRIFSTLWFLHHAHHESPAVGSVADDDSIGHDDDAANTSSSSSSAPADAEILEPGKVIPVPKVELERPNVIASGTGAHSLLLSVLLGSLSLADLSLVAPANALSTAALTLLQMICEARGVSTTTATLNLLEKSVVLLEPSVGVVHLRELQSLTVRSLSLLTAQPDPRDVEILRRAVGGLCERLCAVPPVLLAPASAEAVVEKSGGWACCIHLLSLYPAFAELGITSMGKDNVYPAAQALSSHATAVFTAEMRSLQRQENGPGPLFIYAEHIKQELAMLATFLNDSATRDNQVVEVASSMVFESLRPQLLEFVQIHSSQSTSLTTPVAQPSFRLHETVILAAEVRDLCGFLSTLSPKCTPMEVADFMPVLMSSFRRTYETITQWMLQACRVDTLACLSETAQHSSSLLDIFTIFFQMLQFVTDLTSSGDASVLRLLLSPALISVFSASSSASVSSLLPFSTTAPRSILHIYAQLLASTIAKYVRCCAAFAVEALGDSSAAMKINVSGPVGRDEVGLFGLQEKSKEKPAQAAGVSSAEKSKETSSNLARLAKTLSISMEKDQHAPTHVPLSLELFKAVLVCLNNIFVCPLKLEPFDSTFVTPALQLIGDDVAGESEDDGEAEEEEIFLPALPYKQIKTVLQLLVHSVSQNILAPTLPLIKNFVTVCLSEQKPSPSDIQDLFAPVIENLNENLQVAAGVLYPDVLAMLLRDLFSEITDAFLTTMMDMGPWANHNTLAALVTPAFHSLCDMFFADGAGVSPVLVENAKRRLKTVLSYAECSTDVLIGLLESEPDEVAQSYMIRALQWRKTDDKDAKAFLMSMRKTRTIK